MKTGDKVILLRHEENDILMMEEGNVDDFPRLNEPYTISCVCLNHLEIMFKNPESPDVNWCVLRKNVVLVSVPNEVPIDIPELI